MSFNDFAAQLLRSPLYWVMGRGTMLITLTGRRSGRPVTLPVNFFAEENLLWVTSRRDRVWWLNLHDSNQLTVWLRGKPVNARGELVEDESAVSAQLDRMCSEHPLLARSLRIHLDDNHRPNRQDLGRAASDRLLIKLSLD